MCNNTSEINKMTEDVEMSNDSNEEINIENIINNLIKNNEVFFKSQQKDETDLSSQEKKDIALKVYESSKSNFLMRFGKCLRKEELNYFEQFKSSNESYEINFYLNELKRYFSKKNYDIKNRRYCALNKMKDQSYFSETGMMRRNPLLYDQLVGQFLTEDEKKQRDNIDTQNITFVNLILESIDRKACKEKQNEQQIYEDSVMEEDEDDDDDHDNRFGNDEMSLDVSDTEENSNDKVDKVAQWGEYDENEPSSSFKTNVSPPKRKIPVPLITATEQRLLKDEFYSIMYENFIEGKDKDFDYSLVDNNEEYDNFDIKNFDAEEKYFDSESPEEVKTEEVMKESSSEDELDVFMNRLSQHSTIQDLAKKINDM